MALLMLVMSRRRFSLAIKPAGSSLPELIRRPVLSRVSDSCSEMFERLSVFCAISELKFVLMRLMYQGPFLNFLDGDAGADRWYGKCAEGRFRYREWFS